MVSVLVKVIKIFFFLMACQSSRIPPEAVTVISSSTIELMVVGKRFPVPRKINQY